jgi:hypothetical protein
VSANARPSWLPFPLPAAQALAAPVLICIMLAMLVLPLPAFLLDVFFSFNIAIALVVLLVASYTIKPLDFAAFPTILLITTMLRLALNVASTRAVLMHGHTGPDAAGKVIESFANFLIGGNFAVGIIVFAILTVINFIVVTKGAGRIAEVSARFALDAMPGKQMSIDAELNSGAIDDKEARRRRLEVSQEADFYGSMDGASKFVRGDAIASMLILGINVVGGLIIGLTQHNLTLERAASNYVLLAIGDALVAQIPALVVSLAAGLIVSRVGQEDDIGGQVGSQLFKMPRALGLSATVLGLLGVIPGMPNVAFLLLAAACGYAAWWLSKRQRALAMRPPEPEVVERPVTPSTEASWEDVVPVDMLGLEVGYRLISMIERNQASDLLTRIKGVRKKFANEIGFLPPAVHIKDNLELRPNGYRVTLKGAVIGEGEAFPERFLAINPGHAMGQLSGTPTQDPAFGLPAVWIDGGRRDEGHRDPPEPPDGRACEQAARARRGAAAPRSPGQVRWQARRGGGAQAAAGGGAAEGAAEPARRVGARARPADHRREPRRERAAHAGPRRAHPRGAGRAGAGDRRPDLRPCPRARRDRVRPQSREPAVAGARARCGRCARARRRRPGGEGHQRCGDAPGDRRGARLPARARPHPRARRAAAPQGRAAPAGARARRDS